MEDTIITYIQTEILQSEDDPITSDEDLLTTGLLDSMAAMRLVGFLEEKFDLTIPPEDMVIEHFMTVNNMVTYLKNRKE